MWIMKWCCRCGLVDGSQDQEHFLIRAASPCCPTRDMTHEQQKYTSSTNCANQEKVNIVQVQKDAVLVAREEYMICLKRRSLGFELNTNVETFDGNVRKHG